MSSCRGVRASPSRPNHSTHKWELLTRDVRDVHVVGRWRQVFIFLPIENVDTHKMHLGVTVFPSLRGRHIHDLASIALQHDMSVLAQGRTLHGKGGRGAGIGGIELQLVLREACSISYVDSIYH